MAAMIAGRRAAAPMAKLLEKLLASRPPPFAVASQSAVRSFGSNAMREIDDDNERGIDADHRSDDRVVRRRRRQQDDLDFPFFSGSRLFFPWFLILDLPQVS